MSTSFAPLLFVSLLLSVPEGADGRDGQLVVPTLATTGVDAKVAPVLTELVLEALLTRHRLPALGPSDLKDMLDVEQQKQLLGCEESRCLSELAGALGAARLVSGLVGRLGELYVVSLKLVDLSSAQVLSRASKKFARIEDAPEIMGPLVDELVGAKPQLKVDGKQLIVARKKAETTSRAASVDDFCNRQAPGYFKMSAVGLSTADLINARRRILIDLLLTPFLAELESKVECLRILGTQAEAIAVDALRAARTEEEANGHDLARLEWRELQHGVRLVDEIYRQGLEKEKLGTGARPVELPFVLRPPRPKARTAITGPFADTFRDAQLVVGAACRAVREEKRADFVNAFSAKARAARIDPRDLYVVRLSEAEEAHLDACPPFVLDEVDLDARKKEHTDRGVVRGCARMISKRDQRATFVDVELVNENGAFKISAWPKTPPEKPR